jgi:hypothetical protein
MSVHWCILVYIVMLYHIVSTFAIQLERKKGHRHGAPCTLQQSIGETPALRGSNAHRLYLDPVRLDFICQIPTLDGVKPSVSYYIYNVHVYAEL